MRNQNAKKLCKKPYVKIAKTGLRMFLNKEE
jgi:hypothetical protein